MISVGQTKVKSSGVEEHQNMIATIVRQLDLLKAAVGHHCIRGEVGGFFRYQHTHLGPHLLHNVKKNLAGEAAAGAVAESVDSGMRSTSSIRYTAAATAGKGLLNGSISDSNSP